MGVATSERVSGLCEVGSLGHPGGHWGHFRDHGILFLNSFSLLILAAAVQRAAGYEKMARQLIWSPGRFDAHGGGVSKPSEVAT